MKSYASVIIDGGPPKPLDYAIPEGCSLHPGCRVKVPMRGKERTGTVSEIKETPSFAKVLPITEILSDGLPRDLFELAGWMADYYMAPLTTVLRSMLPASVRTKPKEQLSVSAAKTKEELRQACVDLRKRSPAQARFLDEVLQSKKNALLTELLEKAGTTRSTVDALEKKGLIKIAKVVIDRSPLADQEYFPSKAKTLMPAQQEALDAIVGREDFATFLLYGVTGSGKTEVYLQAIESGLEKGQGAIVLVPEIALTTQTVERFRSRFDNKIAVLHHRLSPGERSDEWKRIQRGEAPIVIGPRSAVFSPVQNLGLIIVDEEQESSYKQTESHPHYHARNVAVMRAKLAGARVVLGSATPSLESMHNCTLGKYTRLDLPTRVATAKLPDVQIVDLKARGKGGPLSEQLLNEIEQRFKVGEQSLLFLNRRGYHSMQWCGACREPVKCPHCDLSLTFHRGHNILSCHLCDYRLSPPPRKCPTCGEEEPLSFKGAGTEQIERSLHAIFPDLRTLRIDADTTRHKGSHDRLLRQFRSGKADVLIGTQMIAKGLHFPQVTLVGVLNSDSSLSIPDFRASEQVFQLLTQVSGRAGRGALPGKVLIQTYMPDSEIIQLASKQDYDAFYAQEIEVRKMFGYPPFTHLIKCTFSGEDEKETLRAAERLYSQLPKEQTLPVTPSGYAKIKDRYRFQFLLRGPTVAPLIRALRSINAHLQVPRSVRLTIDVDPLSTFF